jgi:hypothetical protein
MGYSSLLSFTWSGGADAYLLPAIARTASLALSLHFSGMGCWEPVVEFEPMTRCLGASGSAGVNCPPRCASVRTHRCLLVLVPAVALEWPRGSPLWLSKIKNGHSSIEEWPLQMPMNPGFVMEPVVGFEPTACCLRNSCSATELRRRWRRFRLAVSMRAQVYPICRDSARQAMLNEDAQSRLHNVVCSTPYPQRHTGLAFHTVAELPVPPTARGSGYFHWIPPCCSQLVNHVVECG